MAAARTASDLPLCSDSDAAPEQQPIRHLVVHTCGSTVQAVATDYLTAIKSTPDTYCFPLTVRTAAFTATVWCDEDGIPKRLAENLGIRTALSPVIPIFGTCVVTGGVDDDGNMLPVPDAAVALFMDIFG